MVCFLVSSLQINCAYTYIIHNKYWRPKFKNIKQIIVAQIIMHIKVKLGSCRKQETNLIHKKYENF